ncbi:MAG: hypothetical protein P9L94_13955 [Candidatus Hinthialibacter antarcticus]|nr:hypothetical protein [Candidatus Hinthialibacter antarcticus]
MEEKISHSKRWTIGLILAAVAGAVFSIFRIDLFGEKPVANDPMNLPLADLLKSDPALHLYEESAPRIQTGLDHARLIAIDRNDAIYTVSGTQVKSFDSAGKPRSLHIQTETEISAIEVSNDGPIYLGLSDHIEIFNADGQRTAQWNPVGEKGLITSIAQYENHVFAADAGIKAIHHFDAEGNKINTFGEFAIPSFYFDVAVAGEDKLYAAHTGEHRIETFNFQGDMTAWWGAFSMTKPDRFCGCCNPIHFALLPNNQGFITCEKGIVRVKVYDAAGEFVGYVAPPEQFSKHDAGCQSPESCFSASGVDAVVDSNGRVLVLDPTQSEVRAYSKKMS